METPEEKEEKKIVKSEKSSNDQKKSESKNQICPVCNKTLKNVIQHINKSKICKAKVSSSDFENLRLLQNERRKEKNRQKNAKFRKRKLDDENEEETKRRKADQNKLKDKN